MSAVLTLPSLMTLKVALAILLARWSRLGGSVSNYATSRLSILPKVAEHHGGAEYHGGRVGTVGTHDIRGDVATSRLK